MRGKFHKRIVDPTNETEHKGKTNFPQPLFAFIRYYPKALFHRFIKDDGLFLASGISFAAVTCVIPLLLLVASVLGSILESKAIVYQQIEEILSRLFVAKAYAGTVKEKLINIIEEIITERTNFGLVAIFTLIWTSTNLFAFTRSSLHRIYQVTQTRNIFLSILEDIFWVISAAILFLAVNSVMWMYGLLQNILSTLPQGIHIKTHWLEVSFPTFITFLLFVAMFFVVYRHVPDQHVPRKVALISALTAAILWQSAGWIFSWYTTRFPTFGKIYGAYAFLIVSLLWIYYSGITFIIGGEVGQLYRERHKLELEK